MAEKKPTGGKDQQATTPSTTPSKAPAKPIQPTSGEKMTKREGENPPSPTTGEPLTFNDHPDPSKVIKFTAKDMKGKTKD